MLREKAIEAITFCSDISIFRTGKDGVDYQAAVGMSLNEKCSVHYYKKPDELWLVVDNVEKVLITEEMLSGFKTLTDMAEEET